MNAGDGCRWRRCLAEPTTLRSGFFKREAYKRRSTPLRQAGQEKRGASWPRIARQLSARIKKKAQRDAVLQCKTGGPARFEERYLLFFFAVREFWDLGMFYLL
jgi:hypothetical protein